jgi:hypothetical protein
MALSRKDVTFPAWVERIRDACLSEAVKEVLQARGTAIRSGALQDKNCLSAFRSADMTIEQIEYGRVQGKPACAKAATALRKFTTAAECAAPSATRRRR